MTLPTLTYGTVFIEDCLDSSLYTETEFNLACALNTNPADIFTLTAAPDDAGNEYAYYERDITDFSAVIYNKWKLRYKTDGLMGARVQLVFSDASTEFIFGAAAPQFSTTWTVVSGTVTAAKTVSKIRFWADDFPDSTADSVTANVWYDYLMFYTGTLTFPHLSAEGKGGGLYADFGNKLGTIPVNGKDTDIKQKAGRRNTVFTLRGDIFNAETDFGATPYGKYILQAMADEWCWFTCDYGEMKVLVKDFKPAQDSGNRGQVLYDLVLEEFSYSDKGNSLWGLKGWLGL